jgi:carbamate kinase
VRLVVAIGRSVLLRRNGGSPAADARAAVRELARRLAVLASSHELVVAFGSGPQPGLLALEGAALVHHVECDTPELEAALLEVALAYMLEQEFRKLLPRDRLVASVLTAVAVDPGDEAFQSPDSAIGPSYLRDEARHLASRKGWAFESQGDQCRRVVARPAPSRVAELRAIEGLLDAHAVVIATGGSGLPVPTDERRDCLESIGCVVDSDLAAETLARDLGADMLILLSDGDAVYLDWGTPWQRAIRRASPDCLSARMFHQGSIAGKIAAACRFAAATGHSAAIGSPADIDRIMAGTAGTIVTGAEASLVVAEAGC